MSKMLNTLGYFLVALFLPALSLAQGVSGQGGDIWTQGMSFAAHVNNCDSSTQAFVSIGAGTTYGFCIEKTERTAALWRVARDICVQNGMRLPEPMEWARACDDRTTLGINGMSDGNGEWSSNFTSPYLDSSNGVAIATYVYGFSTTVPCSTGAVHYAAYQDGTTFSFTYRCVR